MFKLLVFTVVISLALGAPHGKGDVGGRIVGGETVDVANYGWTISLQTNGQHFCGAVLVSKNIALTAAHCLLPDSYVLENLSVRAGSSTWVTGGQVFRISRVHNHENYDSSSFDYDISVLFLSSVINTPNARIIALASANFNLAVGALVTVTGWGVLSETESSPSDTLQMVQVPRVSEESCREVYRSTITDNMWCAGYAEGGRDACSTDSGGPAVIGNVLAGLVSFGSGCARPNTPGVYTSISVFRPWIRQTCGL